MAAESREDLAKRLIAEVCAEDVILRDMSALVERIADSDPIADNPDEGDACHYCGAYRAGYNEPSHRVDCDWLMARALVARLKAVQL